MRSCKAQPGNAPSTSGSSERSELQPPRSLGVRGLEQTPPRVRLDGCWPSWGQHPLCAAAGTRLWPSAWGGAGRVRHSQVPQLPLGSKSLCTRCWGPGSLLAQGTEDVPYPAADSGLAALALGFSPCAGGGGSLVAVVREGGHELRLAGWRGREERRLGGGLRGPAPATSRESLTQGLLLKVGALQAVARRCPGEAKRQVSS